MTRPSGSWPARLLGLGFLVAGSLPDAASAQAGRFHPPASEPERVLDAILRRVERDETALDNLLGGRGERGFRPSVDYRPSLTRALLAALVGAERAQVGRECGGRYRDGEVCGLDYNPVTCAQDTGGRRLVSTLDDSEGVARVAVAGSARGPAQATYTLVRDGGTWKLNGVACSEGASFNLQ